ncbi:MAG: hypothetical protein CMP22_02110 [Rickettsiales bacterium]|nr:hypothetical protein [Rickettsiales bacterium]
MFEDDIPQKKSKNLTLDQVDLSTISVDELEDYIKTLEFEIQRAKTEIEKKKSHASAASALFKS